MTDLANQFPHSFMEPASESRYLSFCVFAEVRGGLLDNPAG